MTAYEDLIEAVQDFATARGHRLDEPARDGRYSLAVECSLCERWITISLDYEADETGINGQALVMCPGRPSRPAVRRDENWPSSALANGVVTLG